MTRNLRWQVAVLAVVSLCCAGLVAWGAYDAWTAKQCLDSGLGRSDWAGTSMVAEGCLLETASGPVLVPLRGPTFVATLAALGGGAVSTALLGWLLMRGRGRERILPRPSA
ncbi:hypothetical protein ACFQVC_06815 [Streptomyces monticola]|uniref:Uncharacterized protein n=1 Tax=Streptomyces monticola TaxID=2666263 RepID=A0ABW2JD34_9ACTN